MTTKSEIATIVSCMCNRVYLYTRIAQVLRTCKNCKRTGYTPQANEIYNALRSNTQIAFRSFYFGRDNMAQIKFCNYYTHIIQQRISNI